MTLHTWRNRDHPAYWASIVHRVTGILLALFLPLHFLALGTAVALHQAPGADAVRAILVLLHLLKRNAELLRELRLRDAHQQPTRADASPHDGVDRSGAFRPHAAPLRLRICFRMGIAVSASFDRME